jgi:hypothetical protein
MPIAALVARQVSQDRQEPGAQIGAPFEVRRRSERPNVGILDEVFCVGPIPREPQGGFPQVIEMAYRLCIERRSIGRTPVTRLGVASCDLSWRHRSPLDFGCHDGMNPRPRGFIRSVEEK